MVKASSIIFISISLFLSIVLPLVAAVVLHKKLRFAWKAVAVGAVVFLVFQILTRIPLLGYLQQNLWYQAFSLSYPIISLLLIALSAGLFEEIGRYVGFRLFLKKHVDWESGIAYGIGHGGLESLLVGMTLLNYLISAVVINSGRTSPQIPASVVSALVDTAPPLLLVSGIERVLAFAIQIGLSLVVLYGIKSRKSTFLFLAIVLHTLVDLGAVMFAGNTLVGETYVAIFAAVSLVWIVKSRKIFREKEACDPQQD